MPTIDDQFTVCFRGLRGSHAVCNTEQMRYGGMTTCVEVCAGKHRLILDAGGGLIKLGKEIAVAHRATGAPIRSILLLTHTHHDHLAGLPFFPPLYISGSHVWIAGPKTIHGSIDEVLMRHLSSPFHPVPMEVMSADLTINNLEGGELFKISPESDFPDRIQDPSEAAEDDILLGIAFNEAHPLLGVLHYSITYRGKSFVFATDVEAPPEGDPVLEAFAAGADLLAHDGAYTEDEYYRGTPATKGWGHSTWQHACATAKRAQVKRLAIIHYAPEYTDTMLDSIARQAGDLFAGAFLPHEGAVINLLD